MISVVDASFAGAWILPDEDSGQADEILRAVLEGEATIAVPDLWSYEMVNLLTVAKRRGRFAEEELTTALGLIQRVPCVFYDHNSQLARHRITQFASRFTLSAYDASYLELADRLQCSLLSLDQRLNKAARKLGLCEADA